MDKKTNSHKVDVHAEPDKPKVLEVSVPYDDLSGDEVTIRYEQGKMNMVSGKKDNDYLIINNEYIDPKHLDWMIKALTHIRDQINE